METLIDTLNYEVIVDDELAIACIKQNIFDVITHRSKTDELKSVLNKIQYSPHIKALLFTNESGCYNEVVYDTFIKKLAVNFNPEQGGDLPQFCDKNLRFRELHILDELIEFIVNYKKLCFAFISGEVVTPFFGAFLASDIRYAHADASFSLAHLKYGLHPSGALPYFLVQQVGYNKAMEILLVDKISARETFELGLVNKLIDDRDAEAAVIADIKKVIASRNCSLRYTKQLATFTRNSLSNYFTHERILLNL